MELEARQHSMVDSMSLDSIRQAQQEWAARPIRERLRVLRAARHSIAANAESIATTVPVSIPGALQRTCADTIVAEILPLLEAIRFLEREAARILRTQRMSTTSRPLWLSGVTTEIQRAPLGVVLIIGPANYPIFLPGVQTFQALAAGNAVLWKPAPEGVDAARVLRKLLVSVGLNPMLLTILDETREAAIEAIHAGVDKVFLTGSSTTGRAVMRELAETLTPCVMELSGCDAVFVLEGADLDRVVEAIAFSMRLNGSATCMAARRLFVTDTVSTKLLPGLSASFAQIATVDLPHRTALSLNELIEEAVTAGATVLCDGRRGNGSAAPTLISAATPEMRITQTDIFAPVLSVIKFTNEDEALAAYARCPYRLTAAVFGPLREAKALARRINAGNVLVNDLMAATADPRAPFGGRGHSGFGVTRGGEGLVEMTAVKTLQIQSSRSRRHYQPTAKEHAQLFLGYVHGAHSKGWRQRWAGIGRLFRAARKMK